MNAFGVHGMVLVSDWDESGAEKAIRSAAAIGYDVIEVPLFDPAATNLQRTRDLLRQHKLAPSVSLGLTAETDISSADAAISGAGIAQLQKVVDATAFIGGAVVAGVIGSAWQKYLVPPTDGGYRNAVSGIRGGGAGGPHERRYACRRGCKPFRIELVEHRRASGSFCGHRRRGKCRHSSRHLPHAYRGTGHRGGHPRLRPRLALFPRQRKPSRLSEYREHQFRPHFPGACGRSLRRPDYI